MQDVPGNNTDMKERILQIIPLHSTASSTDAIKQLETHVRTIFRIDDCIQCHAFMTASYLHFKRCCLQRIKGKAYKLADVSFGRGYFALLTPDNILLVLRTPQLQLHTSDMNDDN